MLEKTWVGKWGGKPVESGASKRRDFSHLLEALEYLSSAVGLPISFHVTCLHVLGRLECKTVISASLAIPE